MSHKVKITKEEKKEKVVKIYYRVTLDGEKTGYTELDGKKAKGHFDLDYQSYRDNKTVDKHLKAWAEQEVENIIEKHDPSESVEGREVEL